MNFRVEAIDYEAGSFKRSVYDTYSCEVDPFDREQMLDLLNMPLQNYSQYNPEEYKPTTIMNVIFRDPRTGRFLSYRKLPLANSVRQMLDNLPRI